MLIINYYFFGSKLIHKSFFFFLLILQILTVGFRSLVKAEKGREVVLKKLEKSLRFLRRKSLEKISSVARQSDLWTWSQEV